MNAAATDQAAVISADKHQAEHALKFLDYVRLVEQGGYSELPHRRDLDADEKPVKEAALTCLLVYFSQNPAADAEAKATEEKKS